MTPKRIMVASLAVAGGIIALGLLFANPEQCPMGYSQAQIDATGCNIGANIGLGLIFLFAIGVLIAGSAWAYSVRSTNDRQPPPPGITEPGH